LKNEWALPLRVREIDDLAKLASAPDLGARGPSHDLTANLSSAPERRVQADSPTADEEACRPRIRTS
jgi:hypothetical protein